MTWPSGAVNNLLHFLPAGLFFFCICIICVRFFPEEPMKAKYLGRNEKGQYEFEIRPPNRRTVYFTGLGLLIALCLAGLVYMTVKDGSDDWLFILLEENKGFFWLEVVAVWAFAAAWLQKSKDFKPRQP